MQLVSGVSYSFPPPFQCMTSLQSSVLPEAAEILQILQRIELEGLFFTHDKLAERQVSSGAN